ncbi:glucosyl transferase [Priestia megaterium]|uniref:glycosyltransferase family 2 protein n=1 Tax=Priestia megaterium TaxID=1404 RepID=UPI000BF5E2AA|nr:glycosyltransferase family 2 protein [Priestia megaterium]PEX10219.1 glucosyl transferase [Priestia megaterium]
MKKILVILTCFNRKEKTIKCINSLSNGNKKLEFLFIVVDDNSKDGTVESLNTLPQDITILSGDGNLYWAGGMRKGIEYCHYNKVKCDYVLYVNDDVDFYNGSIEKLVKQEDNKEVVIVGATSNNVGELTYGALKHNGGRAKGLYSPVQPSSKEQCDTFNMNCVLMPKIIFDKMGNLDNVYHHALADLDYGFRISKSGYGIYISENYVGICENNPIKGTWKDDSLKRVQRLKIKESIKGAPFKPWFYYLKKNFGLMAAVKYSLSPYVRILMGK